MVGFALGPTAAFAAPPAPAQAPPGRSSQVIIEDDDDSDGTDGATQYVSSSQGQRYCYKSGAEYVCVVCGYRKVSLAAVRSHVFKSKWCKERL